MKVNWKERIKAIYDICKLYAYRDDTHYFISDLELSFHLNNCWYANRFFTIQELKKMGIKAEIYNSGDIVLPFYELDRFRNRLKSTISRIKGATIIKIPFVYGVWFKIPIKSFREGKNENTMVQ